MAAGTTNITNLRGRKGDRGFQGFPGPAGPASSAGLTTDAAIGANVGTTGTSEARTAVSAFSASPALNAANWGISAANTAVVNRQILQGVVDNALALGWGVRLPHFAFSVSGTVNITTPGHMEVVGGGIEHSKITQTVVPNTIFNVTGPNVTIRDVALIGQTNGAVNMTGAGDPEVYAAYCGIWVNAGADHCRVYNVSGKGLHRAVRIDPGIGVTPAQVPNIQDVVIDGVDVDRCWVGVTYAGLTDGVIRNVRGTYIKATATDGTDVGQPPHLIYGIDRNTSDLRWMYNVNVESCMAWSSTYGVAYALKGTIGGESQGLNARACHGLFDLISLNDYTVRNSHSTSDIYPGSGNQSSLGAIAPQGCTRLTLENVTVRFADMDHGPGFYNLDTDDLTVRGLEVVAQRVTEEIDDGNGYVAVVVKGRRTVLVDPIVTSIHANINAGITCVQTGQDARIINPVTSGNMKYGVLLYTMTGVTVEYDPALLKFNSALGTAGKGLAVRGNATGATIRPKGRALPTMYSDVIAYDIGTDLLMGSHGPSVATSGHVASIAAGTWTTDLTDGRGRSMESSAAGNGVLAYSCGRSAVGIKTKVKFASTSSLTRVGVAFRVIDSANFLAVGLSTTGLELISRVAGVDTVLSAPASTIPSEGRTYEIDVEILVNAIDMYINGQKVGSYTLSGATSTLFGGINNHGFYSNRAVDSRFWGIEIRNLS